MTEYNEAVELIAKLTYEQNMGNDYPEWEFALPRVKEEWRKDARILLSLTDSSGRKVIGVIAKNQDLPITWGQVEMLDAGFVRIIKEG